MAQDPLVLTSRIKKLIKSLGCKCSSDVPNGVNDLVLDAIKKAVVRTRANKRSTLEKDP